MSQSAFGVEHGEIAKAFTRTGKAKEQRAQAKAIRAAKIDRGVNRVLNAPKKAVNAKVSVADVGRTTSGGFKAVGNAVGSRPGLAGAAVLGGGGYLAHRAGQKPQKSKKRVLQ